MLIKIIWYYSSEFSRRILLLKDSFSRRANRTSTKYLCRYMDWVIKCGSVNILILMNLSALHLAHGGPVILLKI